MKFMKSFILLLNCFWLIAHADNISGSNKNLIAQEIAGLMRNNNIPGIAVIAYVNGEPYAQYFGYADLNKRSLVTPDTIFEVGAMSKIITSVLLAQEIDVANMNLNASIRQYLKNLPEDFDDITLEDLATHTSGLPLTVPKQVATKAELQNYLANWNSPYNPGEEWLYSNIGVELVGEALENISNKTFDELYRRHIEIPLGMRSIGTTVPTKFLEFYAQGYEENGKPAPSSQYLFPSALGVKMSGSDAQKLLGAAIGLPNTPERIFYPMKMTQAAFIELHDKQQGLGWEIHSLNSSTIYNLIHTSSVNLGPTPVQDVFQQPVFNGNDLLDNIGETAGFRSYIALVPNKKTGIVLLMNKHISNDQLVNTGRRILFKLAGIT